MLFLIIALTAGAVTPEQLEKRLAEVEALRSHRVSDAPEITKDEYRAAAEGKVPTGMQSVAGSSFKKGYGVRVVDVPIDKIWAAVNDDMGKLEHTKLSYAEVLKGQQCADGRHVFQYLPLPMISDRWWVSEFHLNQPLMQASQGRVREMSWKSVDPSSVTGGEAKRWADQGIPVKSNAGGWFLIDIDGKSTLIEYSAWSDPSGNIPAYLTNSLAQGGIKNTIDAVRTLALQGGTCAAK